MNWKNILTTAGSAFVGGVVSVLITVPPADYLSLPSLKPFLVTAIATGVAAVYHLYQPAPVSA